MPVSLRHCCPPVPHIRMDKALLSQRALTDGVCTARRRKRAKQLAKLRKKVAAVKKANHGKAEGDTDKVPLPYPPALLHVLASLDRAGSDGGAPLLHHRWFPLASKTLRV